jgi:hypothetical protein
MIRLDESRKTTANTGVASAFRRKNSILIPRKQTKKKSVVKKYLIREV